MSHRCFAALVVFLYFWIVVTKKITLTLTPYLPEPYPDRLFESKTGAPYWLVDKTIIPDLYTLEINQKYDLAHTVQNEKASLSYKFVDDTILV